MTALRMERQAKMETQMRKMGEREEEAVDRYIDT